MNFSTLKQDANQEFLKHFRFYFILFLPYLILESIGGILSSQISRDILTNINLGSSAVASYYSQFRVQINFLYLISIITTIVLVGISFQILDIIRNNATREHPLDKSTKLFSTPMVFGVIITILIQFIFIILWTCLLIIPGIIKSYSYSQAIYIYRDAYVSGNKISPLQAITKSRQMMVGHKAELLWLQLSFIGWWILLNISTSYTVIPILGIFVYPYFQITMMNYYHQLSNS